MLYRSSCNLWKVSKNSLLERSERSVPVSNVLILPLALKVPRTHFASETEPDMLSQAFEQDAAEREQELLDIWRAGASTPSEMEFPKSKREDPNHKSSFKGLDRTKIPANADYLVNMPMGLEIFLRLAKNRVPPHPLYAVGLSPGPAFMSYGSAVAEFGEPEAPGEDWPSEDQTDENITEVNTSSVPDNETPPDIPLLSWASEKTASSTTPQDWSTSIPNSSRGDKLF
jgi:hypothetical protein